MAISQLQFRALPKALLKALISVIHCASFRDTPKNSSQIDKAPNRILLLNGFHIGDVVIAASVIPILRRAYPSAEIGFVTGSWSQMVLKHHPDLNYTHCVDHWMLNRGAASVFQKMLQYRKTRSVALREIREVGYDVAISLFTNFPDFLDLSWAAKIPVRIGFRQSIFSSLATSLVDEPESPFVHQGVRLAETLRALPIAPAYFHLRKSSLPPSTTSSIHEVCALLEAPRLEDACYRIIHMGSGAMCRELPVDFWRELAEKLSLECTLLFTGRGRREKENVASTIRGLENCVNACDRLTWDGFVAAVRYAEVLYGVESMAGHVAGAVGTKCVVVYGGTAGVARWRPEGRNSIIVTNHVQCAPCLQPLGCAAMTCMRQINPNELVRLSKQ